MVKQLIPSEVIERKILLIRGEKVMLDSDLARLYEVETFNLNKAVKRNIDRFPEYFMFQLSKEEADSLRFQIGISKSPGRGGRRYHPYVFTEQGVAMLSSVLNSERAVKVNIAIMRTFVKLRQMLASNAELARKLAAMEKKYDSQFKVVFDAIRQLMTPPAKKSLTSSSSLISPVAERGTCLGRRCEPQSAFSFAAATPSHTRSGH